MQTDAEKLDTEVLLKGYRDRVSNLDSQVECLKRSRDKWRQKFDARKKHVEFLSRQLESVTDRMNALALENARLEANAALRANPYPAGTVWFVPTGETRAARSDEWYLVPSGRFAKAEYLTPGGYPIYRRYESPPQGEEQKRQEPPQAETAPYLGPHMAGELNAIVAERDALRQEVERLKSENARLYDNGRCESYLQDLQALTAMCEEIGMVDASTTPHGILVRQLKARFQELEKRVATNQEAADVLRLIESRDLTVDSNSGAGWTATGRGAVAHGRTATASVKSWAACHGITLPAKDDAEKQVVKESLATDAPSPGAAAEQAELSDAELCDQFSRTLSGAVIDWPQLRQLLGRCAAVHQQLAEARKEIERLKGEDGAYAPTGEVRMPLPGEWYADGADVRQATLTTPHNGSEHMILHRYTSSEGAARQAEKIRRDLAALATYRRSHEAWEAVKKHRMALDVYGRVPEATPDWTAKVFHGIRSRISEVKASSGGASHLFHLDPIDAVLALAKELEGKQTT